MALTLHGTVSDNTVALDRKTATPLIINGDMQIAQRGTSATTLALSAGGFRYNDVDRVSINAGNISTGQISTEQINSGLDGFPKAKRITVTTAESSPATSGYLSIQYGMEAQNLQLLKYGTSNALPITLSFYVRSSVTGTFIGNIIQVDSRPSENRTFPYNYTINSANTWEKKVINIDADTSGVISNDNGLGFEINLTYLYIGSNYTSGTVNTWNSNASGNSYMNNPTRVNLLATSGATFDMTAVQLEVGTFDANSIPDFQFEDRGTSLMRCMRYTQCFGGNNSKETFCSGGCNTTTIQTMLIEHKTEMRTTPSVSVSALNDFQVVVPSGFATATTAITLATDNSGPTASTITTNTTSQSASQVGRYCNLRCVDVTNGKLTLSAEL